MIKKIFLPLLLVLLTSTFIGLIDIGHASAATYTVTSTADAGAGSLRQAILDANANVGADIIVFSSALNIQPTSALPNITDTVDINGYTGSPGGATPNTAISPNPLNGTLTIVLDGTSAGTANGLNFDSGSSGSSVKGLVINNFTQEGIIIGAPYITIAGNYIGTDSTGAIDRGNTGNGIGNTGTGTADNITIGGTNSADRNIIAGNENGGASPNTGDDNWTIQGNYFGIAADGVSALPNAQVSGSGAISLDNSNGHIVGGDSPGATNVISGNNSHGIAPQNASNITIQGNFIGTDYTGNSALPNGGNGITLGGTGTGSLIGGIATSVRNIISGNVGAGITCGQEGAVIKGNYVGLSLSGDPLGNNTGGSPWIGGIGIAANNITVGGVNSNERNYVSANKSGGIVIFSIFSTITGAKIQGNYVGTNTNGQVQTNYGNTGEGVGIAGRAENNLVGGTTTGSANIIAGNGSGILGVGLTFSDVFTNNSFLGNSIYGNLGGTISSIGIDLAGSPNGVTFVNTGVTPNDVGDPDSLTNHYMNFPVLTSISSTNGQATITYNLDINDTETGATGYRVEFFANDTQDPSGHGQGQTYLGSDTVSGDVTGRQATITLPAGVEGTKYISAVTTMTDNSTDGFGHSSEFAEDLQGTLVATTSSTSSLASTGQNTKLLQLAAVLLIISGGVTVGYAIRKQN